MFINEMKLYPAPYDLIRDGSKTVEIRLFDEKRASLSEGDLILFKKTPYLAEMLYRKIAQIRRFDDIDELFNAYGPVALGCKEEDTVESFCDGMKKIYSEENISKYGWCAIELDPFDQSELNIKAISARRINDRDIEVYFDGDFEFGHAPETSEFSITVNGTDAQLEDRYGYGGNVHFCRMTTLRLRDRLSCDNTDTVQVAYKDVVLPVPFEDYYKYKIISKSGVPVKGSAALIWGEKTVARAAEIVDIQLSASPAIAAQMVESGASLCIFGRGENAYHIPEHRSGYHVGSLYVEGFGGITCSITEANVWHWHHENDSRPDLNYSTHYRNENILIHEFGHGVKIAGIDRMEDRSLYTEFQMLYRHARSAGLWPNTYAISNSDEYFATLSAIWFNVMNECHADDGWDGTRGPINTRRELYNYDIDAYKFFSKIYPHRDLDGDWTPVPNYYKVTGLKDDPEEDFTGRNYTLNYPETDSSYAGLKYNEGYKLSMPREGLIIDTGASDGYTGVWYDYSGDGHDETSMTFMFEEVSPAVEKMNEEEGEFEHIYTVRIKNVAGGYLAVEGARISAVGDDVEKAAIFTISTMGTHPFGMIKVGDKRLITDGKPDMGTALTLTDDEARRGGMWRLGNFADLAKHLVFIHDGCADGKSRGTVASTGDTVTLTTASELNGKKFVGWVASYGDVTNADSTTATLTMPDSDTVVWAKYE